MNLLQKLTGFHNRRAGAHHIVEKHNVMAINFFEGRFALIVQLDLNLALIKTFFIEQDEFGFWKVQPVVHFFHEIPRAGIRGA